MARELLDSMLSDNHLDEPELRELMTVTTEGQFVEFKEGAKLKDPKAAAAMVREQVSGFANADGGLLVIGIDDGRGGAPRKATTTTAPGGIALDLWARDVLENMKGYLVPFPRFQVMKLDGCDVLIVATMRAPLLVPCVDKRTMAYHLRIGSSTVEVPPYLMSDLVLGRRAHPIFEVRPGESRASVTVSQGSGVALFSVEIENVGFVPATEVRVGLIAWGMRPPNKAHGTLASANLRKFIEVPGIGPPDFGGHRLELVHLEPRGGKTLDLPPFQVGRTTLGDLVIPESGAPMRSALYVIASGHPPEWFQCNWLTAPVVSGPQYEITRVAGDLPEVVWDREWRVGG